MPRLKGTGKGESERINIRLDPETARFYRAKANEHGVSISEYLRQTRIQGGIAENVHEIEQRLLRVIEAGGRQERVASRALLPDGVLLSIFTAESILSEIAEAQDVQRLYKAQDHAKAKLNRLKAMGYGAASGEDEYK